MDKTPPMTILWLNWCYETYVSVFSSFFYVHIGFHKDQENLPFERGAPLDGQCGVGAMLHLDGISCHGKKWKRTAARSPPMSGRPRIPCDLSTADNICCTKGDTGPHSQASCTLCSRAQDPLSALSCYTLCAFHRGVPSSFSLHGIIIGFDVYFILISQPYA